MSSFKNKHVLITGGAGGIGLLMGKLALKEGAAKLVIWDIDAAKLDEAENHLQEYASEILTFNVNISDPEQVYQAADRVLAKIHSLDILINNAGIVIGKRFEQHSRDDIEQTIKINLLGAMHATRAFLPDMIQSRSGHIVNIASASGYLGNPRMAVYASSKWGMIGWSESLRLELEQDTDLKVTTVEPSYIKTGLFAGVTPPFLTPLLEPLDIAKRIIDAVKRDKVHLRAPFMVKLLPLLKGLLPTRLFDLIAGKLFGVYHSMDTFQGRNNSND
ncbi:MAG TPA: SDR family oxidoreductase [Balneolaceae bacterium]|nr:SDR family oxidoreductase [Balneolaceae bacterium]